MPDQRVQPKLEPRFPDTLSLGAVCHQQQQAQYPVFVVTDLDDKIIFGNQQGNDVWKLTKVRTNINRYWQASTAFFQCTIALTDLAQLTPLWPAPEFRHTASISPQTTTSTLPAGKNVSQIISDLESIPISVQANTNEASITENYKKVEILRNNGYSSFLDSIGISSVEDFKKIESRQKVAEKINELKTTGNVTQPSTTQTDATDQQVLDAAVKAFPLGAYDEICIYGGYLDRLRDVTTADIKNNRLLRKGVWSVDTVTVSGSTPTGIIITVQCRDRLKYIMDTFGSYNTAEASEFLIDKNRGADAGKRSEVILSLAQRGIGHIGDISVGGRRIEPGTILDIWDAPKEEDDKDGVVLDGFDPYFMYKGNNLIVSNTTATQNSDGSITATPNGSSMFDLDDPKSRAEAEAVLQDFKNKAQADADLNKDRADVQEINQKAQAIKTVEEFVEFLRVNNAQALGTNGQQTQTAAAAGTLTGGTVNPAVSKEMKFNIVTGRVPYTTSGDQYFGQNFIVADRVPLDYIKFMSQQEPWPTEVFQDSRTGEFWYAPRGLDLTGLSDKSRFFRTYYFRNWPSDLVEQAAAAEDAKETSTSLDATQASLETYGTIISKLTKAEADIEKYKGDLKAWFGDEADKSGYFLVLSNIITMLQENEYAGPNFENFRKVYRSLPAADTATYIEKADTIILYFQSFRKYYQEAAEKAQQTVEGSIEEVNKAKAVLASTPAFDLSYPHPAQMIHTFREEVSSVSVRTNIIVQSHSPGKPEAIQQILHLSVEPWFMRGRAYPCSFFTVTDDSANAAGGGRRKGALIALALAYARVIAKELRVAAATVLGDPSFVPGEVIQVIGSPMNPYSLDPDGEYYWTKDRANIVDMNRQYEILGKELAKLASTDLENYQPPEGSNVMNVPNKEGTPKFQTDKVGENVNSDAAVAKQNKDQGFNYISFKREPPSMWRVEGVVDRFMDGVPGYYTELALLSCF